MTPTIRDLMDLRAEAEAAGLDQFVRQYDRQLARRGVRLIETTARAYAARRTPDVETRSR